MKEYKRLDKGIELCTGGNADENVLQQLERYVKEERKRERLSLSNEEKIEDLPWIGVITDGQRWWLYE